MSNKKIGLISLTALVLSSMIGSGIFSLPQKYGCRCRCRSTDHRLAHHRYRYYFFSVYHFFYISRLRPDLFDGGIYTYAREGFGELTGFLSAWGYWLCATIGIVGYLVVAL